MVKESNEQSNTGRDMKKDLQKLEGALGGEKRRLAKVYSLVN